MENKKEKISISKFLNKKTLIVLLAVIIVLVGGTIAYGTSVKSKVESWKEKAYPGVTVEGIDVGGKTKEEVTALLNEEYVNKIGNKKIIITVGDKTADFSYDRINPTYAVEKAVEESIYYGKEDNLFSKNSNIKNGVEHNVKLDFTYSEEELAKVVEEIKKKLNIAPKEAKISINNGAISITPEVNGYKINDEKLAEGLKNSINGELGEDTTLNFEYETSVARVTKDSLSKINGILGTHQTSIASSSADRKTNVAVATDFVNGTLLMPGDVFSYSQASQKDKSKYKEAAVYINGQVSTDIGGGICQVSTTLYRAAMRANIRSVERSNHSMTVGYSEPGLDATVAWGYIDYKFKNTYESPIYIEGKIANNQVIFNIYGNTNEKGNRTYEMANEILKTIPAPTKTIDDPNLEEGKTIVETKGMTGYVVNSYLITYENGKEINREFIAKDTYKTTDTIIKRGTKKVETPAPTPTEPQAPVEPMAPSA